MYMYIYAIVGKTMACTCTVHVYTCSVYLHNIRTCILYTIPWNTNLHSSMSSDRVLPTIFPTSITSL